MLHAFDRPFYLFEVSCLSRSDLPWFLSVLTVMASAICYFLNFILNFISETSHKIWTNEEDDISNDGTTTNYGILVVLCLLRRLIGGRIHLACHWKQDEKSDQVIPWIQDTIVPDLLENKRKNLLDWILYHGRVKLQPQKKRLYFLHHLLHFK
jgi:hypothetical protein